MQQNIMNELLIRNLNKYVTLSEREVEAILRLFTTRKFRKKQYILQEGDVARHETFILEGLSRIYEIDNKGQEHVVQFGPEDWWVGDLFSFLTEEPSIYNIDCLEDTTVLQITRPDLEALYREVPQMERYFRIVIQGAFIASTRRVASTLTKSATERYLDFVAKYPEIEERVSNHQIASYLGITPQSLSRIRAQKM